MSPAARAAALGAATGSRSSYGLAALALATPAGGTRSGARVRRGLALAAGAETLLDALPIAPSRLRPGSVLVRLGLGAGAAVAAARRDGDDVLQAARLGAAAALAGTLVGAGFRRWGVRGGRHDLPHAVLEDLLAGVVAGFAARPAAWV